MDKKKVSVTDYSDFRMFIRDYISLKKKSKSSFSFRFVAMRLGCNAGFFNRVIKGTRNLSPELVRKLGEVLKLPKKDRKYFELLVGYNQAKTQMESEHYFQQLKGFHNSRIKQISTSQYPLYENWYNIVLREMLNVIPCYDTSAATARRLAGYMSPAVKPYKLQQSLKLLKELNIIEPRGRYGRLGLNSRLITTGTEIPQVVVQRILRQFFELGTESIDRYEKRERVCATLTVSVSGDGYEKIKSKLAQTRKEILDIADQDSETLDKVYHMNMQLFPVTGNLTGESK